LRSAYFLLDAMLGVAHSLFISNGDRVVTTEQIEMRVSLYSNETLREIVASNSPKWKWFKFAAKRELAKRDMEAGLGK
jgi:hypothetical protein